MLISSYTNQKSPIVRFLNQSSRPNACKHQVRYHYFAQAPHLHLSLNNQLSEAILLIEKLCNQQIRTNIIFEKLK